jgi:hypothetical protein
MFFFFFFYFILFVDMCHNVIEVLSVKKKLKKINIIKLETELH